MRDIARSSPTARGDQSRPEPNQSRRSTVLTDSLSIALQSAARRWLMQDRPVELVFALERGRVAERLDQREAAIEAYTLVIDAWANGDSLVQPAVRAAREGLRRLGVDEKGAPSGAAIAERCSEGVSQTRAIWPGLYRTFRGPG